MDGYSTFNHVKTTPINIKKSMPTFRRQYTNECELKSNFFNPDKESPPNRFLSNCKKRLDLYYSKHTVK